MKIDKYMYIVIWRYYDEYGTIIESGVFEDVYINEELAIDAAIYDAYLYELIVHEKFRTDSELILETDDAQTRYIIKRCEIKRETK